MPVALFICYPGEVTKGLETALSLLDAGDVVGMPTETVYGLAARIDRPDGIRKIFAVKERPFFDPLIVHVADIEQARSLTTDWSETANALAERFWPGPLTLILPKVASLDATITSGLETVGLRCPDHPVALELIARARAPLAAPSANKFGRTSPTTAEHVRNEFGESVFVLEGGASRVGIESTILSIHQKDDDIELSLLRKGAITESMIDQALQRLRKRVRFMAPTDKRLAPGQMKHHYMPAIPLFLLEGAWPQEEATMEADRWLATLPDEVEGVKIIKPKMGLQRPALMTLSDDPTLAARELYGELRRHAASGADHILCPRDPAWKGEAWDGLLDRLSRASSMILRRG